MTSPLFSAAVSRSEWRAGMAWIGSARGERALGVGLVSGALALLGCSDSEPGKAWACTIPAGSEAPDFLSQLGCAADFELLASEPLVSTLPGARSVKTSVDREADGELTFQNSTRFPIHWDYLSTNRSVGQGLGRVPALAEFNQTEY